MTEYKFNITTNEYLPLRDVVSVTVVRLSSVTPKTVKHWKIQRIATTPIATSGMSFKNDKATVQTSVELIIFTY